MNNSNFDPITSFVPIDCARQNLPAAASKVKLSSNVKLVGKIALGALALLTVIGSGLAVKTFWLDHDASLQKNLPPGPMCPLTNETIGRFPFEEFTGQFPPTVSPLTDEALKDLIDDKRVEPIKSFETLKDEGHYKLALKAAIEESDSSLKENYLNDLLNTVLKLPSEGELSFEILKEIPSENKADTHEIMFNTFIDQGRLDEALEVIKSSKRYVSEGNDNDRYYDEGKNQGRLKKYLTHFLSSSRENDIDGTVQAAKTIINELVDENYVKDNCYEKIVEYLSKIINASLKQRDVDTALLAFKALPEEYRYLSQQKEKLGKNIVDSYIDKNLYKDAISKFEFEEEIQKYLLRKVHDLFHYKNNFKVEEMIEIVNQMLGTIADNEPHDSLSQEFLFFLKANKKFEEYMNVLERSRLDSMTKSLHIHNDLPDTNSEIDIDLLKKIIDSIDASDNTCFSIDAKRRRIEKLKKILVDKDHYLCEYGFLDTIKTIGISDCEYTRLIKEWDLIKEKESLDKSFKTCTHPSSQKSKEAGPAIKQAPSTDCPQIPPSCANVTCSEPLDPRQINHARFILGLGKKCKPINIEEGKKKFKREVLKYHPDKEKDLAKKEAAQRAFLRLSQVNEIHLSNKK